jgi:hypothetical protein
MKNFLALKIYKNFSGADKSMIIKMCIFEIRNEYNNTVQSRAQGNGSQETLTSKIS